MKPLMPVCSVAFTGLRSIVRRILKNGLSEWAQTSTASRVIAGRDVSGTPLGAEAIYYASGKRTRIDGVQEHDSSWS